MLRRRGDEHETLTLMSNHEMMILPLLAFRHIKTQHDSLTHMLAPSERRGAPCGHPAAVGAHA